MTPTGVWEIAQEDSDVTYRHTQIGWVVLVTSAVLVGIGTVTMAFEEDVVWGVRFVFGIAGVLALLFGWLAVGVTEHQVIIRKRYDLNEFVDVQTVRSRWWHGWGIHFIRNGILYNVSGFDAVELKRRYARAVRIGTDEPRELKQALREALNALHGSHPDWQMP